MKKILEFQGSDKEESVSQILNADEPNDQHIALSEIYNEESEELLEETIETSGGAAGICGENLPVEEITDLHVMSLSLAQETYARVANNETLECGPINLCVDKIADQLIINNNFSQVSISVANGDYLSCHAVNVCIMSLKVGMRLGYDSAKLT